MCVDDVIVRIAWSLVACVHTLKPSFLMANITSIIYCTLTSSLPSFRIALKLSYTPEDVYNVKIVQFESCSLACFASHYYCTVKYLASQFNSSVAILFCKNLHTYIQTVYTNIWSIISNTVNSLKIDTNKIILLQSCRKIREEKWLTNLVVKFYKFLRTHSKGCSNTWCKLNE